jgi:type II secretory pathway pseudopilin PulG
MRRPTAQGFHLVELVVTAAVAALALLVAAPPLARAATQFELRLAAGEVAGSLRQARAYAIRHAAHVGLKFRTSAEGTVYWALYRDGDGDGVLAGDIAAGTDPIVREAQLQRLGAAARFGFPPGPAPRDPGDPRRRLDRLDDPIRFNRSDMASFDPLGTATPGTVYLTDGRELLVAVRVTNRTGRVRVLRYDRASETWEGI